MLNTINGLPTHPLLAHLVAALVPLTALLAVLSVLWPAARRRIGAAAPLVATATLLLIPVTTTAGAWLDQRVMMGGEVLNRHMDLGSQLVVWVALLTICVICWWALHTPLFADAIAGIAPVLRRIGVIGIGLATVVLSGVCLWWVVRVGDTGTRAVWGALASGRASWDVR